MRTPNVRAVARKEIQDWIASNPRKQGETLRQYRTRAQQGVSENVQKKYGNPVWLTFFLQVLPLLIEWFINRKS